MNPLDHLSLDICKLTSQYGKDWTVNYLDYYFRLIKKNHFVVAASLYGAPVHEGHLAYLNASKALGTYLVVIVNSDYQTLLKGSNPFMNEFTRCSLIRELKPVDLAFIAIDQDRSVQKSLSLIKPHVFTNGGDVTLDQCREREVCEKLGIKMVFGVGGTDKIQSSSSIVAAAQGRSR